MPWGNEDVTDTQTQRNRDSMGYAHPDGEATHPAPLVCLCTQLNVKVRLSHMDKQAGSLCIVERGGRTVICRGASSGGKHLRNKAVVGIFHMHDQHSHSDLKKALPSLWLSLTQGRFCWSCGAEALVFDVSLLMATGTQSLRTSLDSYKKPTSFGTLFPVSAFTYPFGFSLFASKYIQNQTHGHKEHPCGPLNWLHILTFLKVILISLFHLAPTSKT